MNRIISEKSIRNDLQTILRIYAGRYIVGFNGYGDNVDYDEVVATLLNPEEAGTFAIYSTIVERTVSPLAYRSLVFYAINGSWNLLMLDSETKRMIAVVPVNDIKPYEDFESLLKVVKRALITLGYEIF